MKRTMILVIVIISLGLLLTGCLGTTRDSNILKPEIRILDYTSSLVPDSNGNIHVTGHLQNIGTATTQKAQVWATWKDSSGEIITKVYDDMYDVKPGEIRGFDIYVDPTLGEPDKYNLSMFKTVELSITIYD